ncbi:hypothetical protein BCR41DRAFT_299809 [Lobosporangium transversale]|uniref:Phosphodiesterase n=1 Tax=Lobosporangium transversale TaxID=64571 RepID=A0A1Y2GZV4_9FUNG|nr:hypothetical protein BCR41DRAFT_299809 [Lobosporangium transversale]ORZ27839.1 hypothetical protein BCR41DRAFT_299809 [Lobosporangium transversale]|eukprot:XP_021885542.1 hypothetical protein BCR41DRAFT_299809 [Lobosporangium transversale]
MLITRHCQQSSDDLFTCERVMLRFLSGKCEPRGLDFNVWDYSMPEIYGIILGMFTKLGLVECLGISESDLLDFIIDVDKGYHATYYHSFYHAADVTAVLYRILFDMNASQYLTKPDMATLLLAGLCHDIGHPGLNNLFQVNAKTELYERYGEASVLEKYSCSLAMELVAKHKLFRNIASSPDAILPEGNHPTEDGMKDAMIKAIMATDMSFHYDMLNNLNTLIEVISTPLSSPSISDNEPTEAESGPDTSLQSSPTQSSFSCNCTALSSPTVYKIPSLCSRFSSCPVAQQPSHIHHHDHHRRQSSISSTSSISSSDSGCSEESTQTTHSLDMGRPSFNLTPELRQSLCNCLLHAADISNAVKPWGLCKRWSDMIVQEFFRQGDIEKARNLPISPNMDRNQHNQAQISLGFADFVVRPYFESLAAFLPDAAPFLTTLASNRAQWLLQKEALEAAKDMSMNTCVATVAETHETNGISSPIQPHLTTGRRVSGIFFFFLEGGKSFFGMIANRSILVLNMSKLIVFFFFFFFFFFSFW